MVSPIPAAPRNTASKPVARVAIIGLDVSGAAILNDCFKMFAIETVRLSRESAPDHFQNEKFEACVLRLDQAAGPLLTAVRTSPSNHRMVVYGIAGTTHDAMLYSRYGINAFINDPIERQNALRAIRATRLLVLNELRRYVRIPVLLQLEIASAQGVQRVIMHEISGGGMSVGVTTTFEIGDPVDVLLTLPEGPTLSLNCRVAWTSPKDGLAGFRFDSEELNRFIVKKWIDDYLDIS